MNHLKTFETFIIPKPIRRFIPGWSDEDIALQVLKELKDMKGNHQEISKLGIIEDGEWLKFNLDGFDFKVAHYFVSGPGGGSYLGSLEMNNKDLSVSDQVCEKIQLMLYKLLNSSEDEITEYDKKDFRMRMKSKK